MRLRKLFAACPACGRHWDAHTPQDMRTEIKATNDQAVRDQAATAEALAIVRVRAAYAAERRAVLRGASEDEIRAARRAAIQHARDEEIAMRAEVRAIVRAKFALAAELRARLDGASDAKIAAARRAAIRWVRKTEKRDR